MSNLINNNGGTAAPTVENPYEFVDEEIEQIKQARKNVDNIDVQIEGFVAEDFATEEPYIYILANHGNNEIKYRGLKIKLRAQAERCKVKTRDFNDMCKAVEANHKDLLPGVNAAAAPEEEAIDTSRFYGDKQPNFGTHKVTATGGVRKTNPFGGEDVVSRQPLIISRVSENVDTGELSGDIAFLAKKVWKIVPKVPYSDLFTANAIVKRLSSRGVNITSETARDVVQYLSEYEYNNYSEGDVIPETKTTSMIGWKKDGTFAPITGNLELDTCANNDYEEMSAALKPGGDETVWFEGVKKHIRQNPNGARARIVMAASFAAPLIEKLVLPPFWVHMEALTGSAKTVALRLAASVWAWTDQNGGYMRSMDNTTTAMEELAAFANNLPLCLNELQLIQDERNFSKRVYKMCEGEGRGRGAKEGGLRNRRRWRLVIISTGEQPLVTSEDSGGANNRVVAIRIKDGDPIIDDATNFCLDVLDKSWGHAGKKYLDGIKGENFEARKRQVISTMERLKGKGKSEKQAICGAILLLADELAEKYVFGDNVRLTEDDILPYLKDEEEVNDRVRAYSALVSLIDEKRSNFTDETNFQPVTSWGKIEKVTASGNSEICWFKKANFDKELRDRNIDPDLLVDWCIDHGIIEDGQKVGDGKHKAIKHRVRPGKDDPQDVSENPWCYKIYLRHIDLPTKMQEVKPSADDSSYKNDSGLPF